MEKFELHILGCGSALPTTRHFATSQVVNLREKLFMIDCGEGAQMQLRRSRLKFSRLNHIFISHLQREPVPPDKHAGYDEGESEKFSERRRASRFRGFYGLFRRQVFTRRLSPRLSFRGFRRGLYRRQCRIGYLFRQAQGVEGRPRGGDTPHVRGAEREKRRFCHALF